MIGAVFGEEPDDLYSLEFAGDVLAAADAGEHDFYHDFAAFVVAWFFHAFCSEGLVVLVLPDEFFLARGAEADVGEFDWDVSVLDEVFDVFE